MSYRIKRNNTQYEVWACPKQGQESLVGLFPSFVDAAAYMRNQASGINKEELPPAPKVSYVEQLRLENQRLKAEVARLKALLEES